VSPPVVDELFARTEGNPFFTEQLVAAARAAGRGGRRRIAAWERAVLHERAARALAEAGDPGLAAEVAGHWQAAGRPAEELPARLAAAGAAERVFGYAQAAGHWQRTIELAQSQPDAAAAAGIDLPRLYLRAVDTCPATAGGPPWPPRRPGAGSPVTRTPPSPRSSGTAPPTCGRRMRPPPGCR
jgi:hypothetical protein